MIDNNYLDELPKNELLAANRICSDFFAGRLTEQPADIAYTLQILLGGRLPVDWDAGLDVHAPPSVGLFWRNRTPNADEKRISRIHRHVKALYAKATITEPSLINIFLVELSQSDKKKIDDSLAKARSLLRDDTEIEGELNSALLRIVDRFHAETDKAQSDFRVFLDRFVEAVEEVSKGGQHLMPVFALIRSGFDVIDEARKQKEAREVPRARTPLPAPHKSGNP